MSKTATAPHLLPTDDLRSRLDREVGGLTISLKNRGLHWLLVDMDGHTIVANYFPAQSLLNVHAGGAARPTFQASGVEPDDIPPILSRHLDRDSDPVAGEPPLAIESDLSDRQRDLLFRIVVSMAGNPQHAKTPPLTLAQRARDIVVEATAIQAQDKPPVD